MRLPRMTTRRWMIHVAIVAIVIAAGKTRQRWVDYPMKAKEYALWERHFLDLAEEQDAEVAAFEREVRELREGTGHRERYEGDDALREQMARAAKWNALGLSRFAAQNRKVAAHYGRLKRKYQLAVVLPWLAVEPDPPAPPDIPSHSAAEAPPGARTSGPRGASDSRPKN